MHWKEKKTPCSAITKPMQWSPYPQFWITLLRHTPPSAQTPVTGPMLRWRRNASPAQHAPPDPTVVTRTMFDLRRYNCDDCDMQMCYSFLLAELVSGHCAQRLARRLSVALTANCAKSAFPIPTFSIKIGMTIMTYAATHSTYALQMHALNIRRTTHLYENSLCTYQLQLLHS